MATITRGPRTLHIGIEKGYLIRAIRQYGAKEFLPGWEGTEEEAIAAVEADGREVFASCNCKKDERGGCTGEPE